VHLLCQLSRRLFSDPWMSNLDRNLFILVQMKLSVVVTIVVLMAPYFLTTCLSETLIDDNLVQQILDDPQLSALLDDPEKLMDLIRQKLRSPSKLDNKCSSPISRRHTIIKTKESKAAGAIFLTAQNVKSPRACVALCCANSSCNTAVMKQKVR